MRDEARWARPGPHPVRTDEIGQWTTVDGAPVAVLARYPTDAGPDPLPVVVCCHGLGGDHTGYAQLGHHLASHGYAVLHPRFRDSLALAGPELGLSGVDESTWAKDPVARQRMHTLLFDPKHWTDRVRRVHAILDSLSDQRHVPARLCAENVLIAGHSFGAYTAQLLIGTQLDHAAMDADLAHPRALAALLFSPQGSGDRGLTPHSWDTVTRPLLVVTGTNDLGANGEGLAWRREPFDRAAAPIRHLAVVQGGDHQLGGLPRPDTAANEVRTAVIAVATAFADLAHGDRAAGAWLAAHPFPTILDHAQREDTACPTT